MSTTEVMVFGMICRINAEIEAAKADNKEREVTGQTTFNYGYDFFTGKAEEIQSAINELFK